MKCSPHLPSSLPSLSLPVLSAAVFGDKSTVFSESENLFTKPTSADEPAEEKKPSKPPPNPLFGSEEEDDLDWLQ